MGVALHQFLQKFPFFSFKPKGFYSLGVELQNKTVSPFFLATPVILLISSFSLLPSTRKVFTYGVKGYYENFSYEVFKVVIFLIEDSVMQKSILNYDKMVLNFFINTIANFVYEGCFISLCTVV